MASVIDLTAPS
jgi:hypothetical protein